MKIFTGALPDPRTEAQKATDYTHEEQLGAGPGISWVAKTDWVKLSVRDQNGSGSCGAQAGAKAMEIYKKVVESAVPIFRNRSNYPSTGMYMQEIGSILFHKGTTLETLCPSQLKNDAQMDSTAFTDTPDIISGYYNLPVKDKIDMDLIAQALEKGHAVIFGIETTYLEWQGVPIATTSPVQFSHFVCCAPPNYLLHNAEKSVVIDDSFARGTSLGNTGQRILTESFLKARCWGVLCLIPYSPSTKPIHTFTLDMVYGNSGPEVKALQECLIYEGLLQTGYNTAYFGSLTLTAVLAFQNKYKNDILVPAGVSQATGKVGKYTRQKLNQLYGS